MYRTSPGGRPAPAWSRGGLCRCACRFDERLIAYACRELLGVWSLSARGGPYCVYCPAEAAKLNEAPLGGAENAPAPRSRAQGAMRTRPGARPLQASPGGRWIGMSSACGTVGRESGEWSSPHAGSWTRRGLREPLPATHARLRVQNDGRAGRPPCVAVTAAGPLAQFLVRCCRSRARLPEKEHHGPPRRGTQSPLTSATLAPGPLRPASSVCDHTPFG
jgi:hypothetical protein